MSVYLYLRCDDHTPPMYNSEESGQHLSQLPQIRHDIAHRTEYSEALRLLGLGWYDIADRYRRRTVKFLSQHPHCHISIIDEYGHDHTTEESDHA